MKHSVQELLDLLETVGPRVHVLLTKLTGQVDAAEDLLQELFLKLSQSAGFKTAPNQEAYLLRSTIHIAFDWRKQNRKLVSLEDSKIEITQPGISPAVSSIHAGLVGEALHAFRNALRRIANGTSYFRSDARRPFVAQFGIAD